MKRILVTGSNGLIGTKIIESLHSIPSLEVFGTSRSQSLGDRKEILFDLQQISSIHSFLDQINPRLIIHTAAVTSVDYAEDHPDETTLVNVEATRSIAEWCASQNARLVYFSTDFVFDGETGMYTELDEPLPISHYGRTKRESELIVMTLAPDSAILRTVLVYGYSRSLPRLNFPLWVKRELEAGRNIQVTADQYRTPTYAEDLAASAIQVAHSDWKGVLHVSGSEYVNMYEFALRTAEVFGLKASLIEPVSTAMMQQRGPRPLRTGFHIDLAYEQFNFRPRLLTEGLKSLKAQMSI